MYLSDVKVGDVVYTDGGFTCMSPGPKKVKGDVTGLYLCCAQGRHYLDGQKGTTGSLIGISEDK